MSKIQKTRKRRVFLWAFLAIQAVFIALIAAYAAEKTGPSHADLVTGCYNHAWWPLFKSQADCVTHYGGALNDAGHVGQGIGIALVIGLWVAADVILGIGRFVVLTARRHRVTQAAPEVPPVTFDQALDMTEFERNAYRENGIIPARFRN